MRSELFRFFAGALIVMSIFTTTMAQTVAFDVSRMDRSADACDDFFQYANGTWVKNTEIPPAFPRWGSFTILQDNNQNTLRDILDAAAKAPGAKNSDTQLIGDLYASCMDEAQIEAAGTKPLEKLFKKIDKIKSPEDVKAAVAFMHKNGGGGLFGFGAGPDAKDSNSIIVNMSQGGLSLPNKDFYTKTDAKSVEIRGKFVDYATTMFKLLGDDADTAARNASTVLALQTRLANASLSPVELRDPDKRYHKMPLKDAQAITPNFDWSVYMKERGFPMVDSVNVGQPEFFKEMDKMITEVPADQWRTYFRWTIVNGSASRLPKAFGDANFDFFGRTLTGAKEQQPRWKRCVQVVDGTLGEALGMAYAKVKFTPEMKARMNVMIDNLFVAMKDHINGLDWMGAETKTKALAKLAAYKRKIGYPDKLRGYAGLKIDRKSYFDNGWRAGQFQIKRNIEDIGKPADKTRMNMTPPTVNASYSPQNNDITFPAGILQPPFFNFNADDAINYGGIGAVIGHEITHGFDDQGSRFDANGNLEMWWTPEDRKKFEERAACVVDQFNNYSVAPGVNINGRLTLGENIGDLGGMAIAYSALMESLKGKPRPADVDGFTPEQRFFLGWAQVWATKATPEYERNQVLTDPHSAARYRVNGPVSNMPEFAKAFGCKQGQAMVRKNACLIW